MREGRAMSAKKRRRKAQIGRLVRMDATYHRLYLLSSPRRDGPRSWRLWFGCVVALGDALEKKQPGAWAALPRSQIGTGILLHNFNKRNQYTHE
jgi:hypothetical protein